MIEDAVLQAHFVFGDTNEYELVLRSAWSSSQSRLVFYTFTYPFFLILIIITWRDMFPY